MYITAKRSIGEIFIYIENSVDQETMIDLFVKSRPELIQFLRWYIDIDISHLNDLLPNIRRDKVSSSSISKNLPVLKNIKQMHEKNQLKLIESLLCSVQDEDYILFEHVLTRSIKDLYPNINWDIFSKYVRGL